MTIQVSELRQEAKEDSHDLIARVCFKGRTRDVVFSRFSSESQLFESEPSFDPFLILLLLPAMRVGEAIEIEGEVMISCCTVFRHSFRICCRITFRI